MGNSNCKNMYSVTLHNSQTHVVSVNTVTGKCQCYLTTECIQPLLQYMITVKCMHNQFDLTVVKCMQPVLSDNSDADSFRQSHPPLPPKKRYI